MNIENNDIEKAIYFAQKLNVINMVIAGSRPGSNFLHSLLDSHPEIILFPTVCDYYSFFPNLDQDINSLVEDILNQEMLFSTLHMQKYIAKTEGNIVSIDKELFSYYLREILLTYTKQNKISHKSLFEFVHVALALTLKKDIAKLKYIFVHFHSQLFEHSKYLKMANFFIANYPNFYNLIPYKNTNHGHSSWFRHLSYDLPSTIPSRNCYITYVINILSFVDSSSKVNKMLIDSSRHNLMLETPLMHKLQEKAMRQISDFLEIEYNSCLCHSTFLGEKWSSNTTDCKKTYGFDEKRTKTNYYKESKKIDILLADFFALERNKVWCVKEEKQFTVLNKVSVFAYLLIYFLFPGFTVVEKKELRDVNIIKDKKQISNKTLAKFPLFIAKKIILLLKFKRINKGYYKRKYNAKNFLFLVRLLSGNFSKVRIDINKIPRLKEN